MLTINNQFSAARNHFGGDLEPPTVAPKSFKQNSKLFLRLQVIEFIEMESRKHDFKTQILLYFWVKNILKSLSKLNYSTSKTWFDECLMIMTHFSYKFGLK